MATVKDVAREAGVSIGTVSNVLNGKSGVKSENREKVFKAVKKLGYYKGKAIRVRRPEGTKNIGLILPNIENPFFSELARGVEDEANKVGYTVFLCNSDRKLGKERRYVNALLSKGIDGLILAKPQLTGKELKRLNNYTTLVLEDWNEDEDNAFLGVSSNGYMGVVQGMNLLYQYGHRRIGIISGLMESYSSRGKMKAYEQCLESWNVRYRPEYVVYGDYSWDSGYSMAMDLLELSPVPTAIFAFNDVMAMGAMKAALARGFRVPEDISVLGYDDIWMSKFCTPALTTIHLPKYQIGVEAVKLIRQSLAGEDLSGDEGKVMLETRIVMRESVGYCADYSAFPENRQK